MLLYLLYSYLSYPVLIYCYYLAPIHWMWHFVLDLTDFQAPDCRSYYNSTLNLLDRRFYHCALESHPFRDLPH